MYPVSITNLMSFLWFKSTFEVTASADISLEANILDNFSLKIDLEQKFPEIPILSNNICQIYLKCGYEVMISYTK